MRTLKIVRDLTGSQCRSQGKVDVLVSFTSSDKACSSVFEVFEVYPVPVLGDYKGYYYSSLQFSLRVCSAVDRMDQYVFFFSLFRAEVAKPAKRFETWRGSSLCQAHTRAPACFPKCLFALFV